MHVRLEKEIIQYRGAIIILIGLSVCRP